MKERREAGAAEIRNPALVGSVSVHHPDVHPDRPYQIARDQRPIVGRIRCRLRMPGAIHDLLAVGGKERAAIVAECVRQACNVRAVHAHRVDIEVAVAQRREHDRGAIRRQRAFRIVVRIIRQPFGVPAIGVRDVDVVIEERPDVTLGIIGARRAGRCRMLRGRVEDAAVIREEIAARRAPLAVRHAMQTAAIDVHHEHLVAT